MRPLRIIIGVILIAAAFWPASLALVMFGTVRSRIAIPPGDHVTEYVITHGHRYRLAPWQIYAIPAGSAVTALVLVAGGIYLILVGSNNDNDN